MRTACLSRALRAAGLPDLPARIEAREVTREGLACVQAVETRTGGTSWTDSHW